MKTFKSQPATAWLPGLLLITALGHSATAAADDQLFKSSQGFSIKYPADWKLVSKDQTDDVNKPLLAKLGPIDLDKLAVFIFDPNGNILRGISNLNVVVAPGSLPLDKADENNAQLRSTILQNARMIGGQASNIKIGVETVGGRKALVGRYLVTGLGGALQQRQVWFPGRNKTFIVTCTSSQADFPKFDPIFQSMTESVTYDSGFAGWPLWAQYAVIGGVVGGFAGGVLWLVKKIQRKASPPAMQ